MNERLDILKMLEQGKINADEAAKLLEAVEVKPEVIRVPEAVESLKGKMFRMKVLAKYDNQENVDVSINLPLSLLKLGCKIGNMQGFKINDQQGFSLSEEDINAIFEAALRGETGEIMTVDSNAAKVKIYID